MVLQLQLSLEFERSARIDLQVEKEASIGMLAAQIAEVIAQRDATAANLEAAQNVAQRCGIELHMALERARALEERVSMGHEAQHLIEHRQHEAERRGGAGSTDVTSPPNSTLVSHPQAARNAAAPKEVVDSRHTATTDGGAGVGQFSNVSPSKYEARVAKLVAGTEMLTSRLKELERQLADCRAQSCDGSRRQTLHAIEAQVSRQRLLDVKKEAMHLSHVFQTTVDDLRFVDEGAKAYDAAGFSTSGVSSASTGGASILGSGASRSHQGAGGGGGGSSSSSNPPRAHHAATVCRVTQQLASELRMMSAFLAKLRAIDPMALPPHLAPLLAMPSSPGQPQPQQNAATGMAIAATGRPSSNAVTGDPRDSLQPLRPSSGHHGVASSSDQFGPRRPSGRLAPPPPDEATSQPDAEGKAVAPFDSGQSDVELTTRRTSPEADIGANRFGPSAGGGGGGGSAGRKKPPVSSPINDL